MTQDQVMAGIANEFKMEAEAHHHIFDHPREKRTDRFITKTFMQAEQDAWDQYFIVSGFEKSDVVYNYHRLDVFTSQAYIDF